MRFQECVLTPHVWLRLTQAAYIDTEGTFRPERIRTIADRFGMDAEAVLDNIIVGRAANSEHRELEFQWSIFERQAKSSWIAQISWTSVSIEKSKEMELVVHLAAKFAEDGTFKLLVCLGKISCFFLAGRFLFIPAFPILLRL